MNGSLIEIPHHMYVDFSEKSNLLFFREHQKLIKTLLPLLADRNDTILL